MGCDSSKIKYENNYTTENKNITRATGIISLATFISRVTGYIRDMIFASFFGVGMISDAFIAAFRIPNLLRRLLGEGSLSIAFIPVFTHYIVTGDYNEAYRLATSALRFLFICLVIISLIGIILVPSILNFVTPGFIEFPLKMELTVTLTRIMFPYIIFAGMVALCMGILNVLGHFSLPAVAPVLLNLSMIGSLFLANSISSDKKFLVIGLSIGVLVGGFFQLILQLPILARKGVYLWRSSKIWHPGFEQIGFAMLPTVLGSASYQINILVGSVLASLLIEGSVTCLYYADRIVQFPLGVFAYSFATAILPSLSRQISMGNYEGVGDTFINAMNFLLFLTIPAMAGLVLLRQPIVELLFARGAFDGEAVKLTSDALLYYAVGLWAFSSVRMINIVFFAFRDTATPVKMAIFSMGINIVLGIVFMKYLDHCGLALATSVASVINLITLVYALTKKIETILWRSIGISTFKTVLCVLFMAVGVISLKKIIMPIPGTGGIYLTTGLFLCIITGILIFVFSAFIMKMPQLKQMLVLVGCCSNDD